MLPLEEAEEIGGFSDELAALHVEDALHRLPKAYAAILRLVAEGYPQEVVARKLNVPVGTVKSRLHEARRLFRAAYYPDTLLQKKGIHDMKAIDYLHGFPMELPALIITKKEMPFPTVRCEEDGFIIPRLGSRNAEGTYRLGKLALVSNCYVPKRAMIHEVEGVKICRDTYNLRAKHLYKNEAVWFAQLTDEYLRNLASLRFDEEEDTDYPTSINTFLEESYDVCVNGNDRIHGLPVTIVENPVAETENGLFMEANVRYTMGVHEVTIGKRTFTAIKVICVNNHGLTATETYIDLNGRILLMNWYESDASLAGGLYSEDTLAGIRQNPTLTVSGMIYHLVEHRISEYAL